MKAETKIFFKKTKQKNHKGGRERDNNYDSMS